MYLLIVFLPLFNLFISGIFGRFLGRNNVFILVFLNMLITFFLSVFIFYEVGYCKYNCIIDLYDWIKIHNLKVTWTFFFDSITVVMLLLVIFVSLLVHLYSFDYMSEDPHNIRFVGYLSLFTFFMEILVTSGNFVQLFLGWEGVGISSYLLINFWFTRLEANKAAIKAVIMNRFGDFGLYFALILIFLYFKTFDFATVFPLVYFFQNINIDFMFFHNVSYINLLSILIIIAAVGKSAQFGLHTWLPDAMEGPTPVSALIHAATMVTAGVFVLIRCSPILELSSSKILFLISAIGLITAFFAGTIGMVQYDIKKVIAYSTCSQLGFMFFSCGFSNYSTALFHLFNHGFFKALLFLGAGSVIHALSDEQDMRKMGGLVKILPLTYVSILIGSLALIGFPFLTGFYSKDVILELSYLHFINMGNFTVWLAFLATFLTSFYSFRLLYLVFWFPNSTQNSNIVKNAHESNSFIMYALCILSICSIFVGFLFKDLFVGLGTDFFVFSVYDLNGDLKISEFSSPFIKNLPFIFTFLGFFLSYKVYGVCLNRIYYNKLIVTRYKKYYIFLSKKWYIDTFYNNLIVYYFLKFCYNVCFKAIDRGYLEIFGPLSIVRLFNKITLFIHNYIHTGNIRMYVGMIIFGLIFYILFCTSFFELFIFSKFLNLEFFNILMPFFKKIIFFWYEFFY